MSKLLAPLFAVAIALIALSGCGDESGLAVHGFLDGGARDKDGNESEWNARLA